MKHHQVWKMAAVIGLVLLAACAGQPANVRPTATLPGAAQGPLPTSTSGAAPTATAAIPVTSTEGVPTQAGQPTAEAAPGQTAAPSQAAAPAQMAVDCAAPAELTPAMTEGPYFTAGSPETKNLAGDLPGTRLRLTGYVLDTNCQPVANAKIDFWQADAQGVYDNNGYTLRGHQFTAADGSYELITVVPGEYPGRTEHIHLKVQAPNGPELTSQLFFPGVRGNQTDRIFDQGLVVNVVSEGGGEMAATYNFVVDTQ